MALPSSSCSPSFFAVRELTWLIGLAFGSVLSVQAQTVQVAAVGSLREVVVSGSRSEQDPDELPMSIDVIRSQDIESQQIHDIRDLAKDLPNVSVKRAPARFGMASGNTGRDGNAGFNIRGLDGNRVLLLTDGIRMPRSYVFSANAFGRDYFDIGLVKRVEVVRGPASVLYGSDGVAGLVNFITYEPSDFLTASKTFGGRVSASASSDDNGVGLGATLAGRANEVAEWLIGVNASRSDGLKNMGTNDAPNLNRTKPNPETDHGNSLLGKLVLRPNADQKHVLTFEHVEKKADYNLLSAVAAAATASTSVLASTANTDMQRDRLTWDARYQLGAAWADSLQTVLSYQAAASREAATEDRNTAADRARDTSYDENTWQLGLQANKTLRLGSDTAHKLTYGVDYVRSTVKTLQTGVTPPAGETFPLKRFPDTVESSAALYLQDEVMHGNWSITPGVRLDRFSIDASQDGFSGTAVSMSDSAVSPKLGLLYRTSPQWSVFGNIASGFRAPNAGQVNAFFENVTQFYKTIPNPNLKPEKSQNFEIGTRGRVDALTLDVAAFTGRFKDLIEDSVQVGGAGTAANPTVFQSINVGNARISGFEVKGNWDWGRVAGGQLTTPFTYGMARGKDSDTGKPLDSIDPAKLRLGMQYATGAWDLRLDLAHHAAKKQGDTNAALFVTPAATTLDLGGQWRIQKDLRLNVAVTNLTDKKYWNWSDVRSATAAQVAVIDAFSQPGRSLKVSLVAEF
ncbi:hemoglobin/transferrin/lactoferrin receptor protein [Rhodoferax sp. OV413]|uniref:TonB-dependent hemoglobin/transferrin/lactoferrin family receptor n=1 Tax=Rhodoferax sp. OV413 TaxID=1855285 RepID=UPI0008861DDD|nr:TonB-dependent hemoglobin/transferrin/lactoferrin family receptor [Rhodoferax sp. OV413]SDP08432.1 hemoglobin/transferrin/lactoferrin receptor protein [Rhodoferax sp. OV413]